MKFLVSLSSFFIFFLLRDVFSLLLNDVDVPSMVVIDNKDAETIFLDCKYDLENYNSNLVVKWLKDNQAVYQWIKGQKPSVFPQFKDKIDDSFKISSDPNQEYRGLALVNPTIDTTGIYKCIVQTAETSQSKEKRLQVVDISNYTLNLYHHRTNNETHLECTVDNVFPEPTINLTTDDDDIVSVISATVNKNYEGRYNATTVAVINDDDEDDDDYRCTITFTGLSLNLTTTESSGYGGYNKLSKLLLLFVFALYFA